MINLLKKAQELLKIFNDNGFEAYLVGGFVRDYVLNKPSTDFDICTNATPKEVKNIFNNVKLPFEGYGSVHLNFKKINFEITTYRMDLEYKNGRSPSKIMYTDKLIIDLKRRDFIMNTLCMDKDGNIIDLLNAMDDIKNKTIRCIGDPYKRLKEDSLRILRAIRFATVLDFKLDESLKKAIIKNKRRLKKLSYFRKKQELNKIFSSPNALVGIKMIKYFGLEKYLGIKLNNVVKTNDPLGIWVQVSPSSEYQFTNNEKRYIEGILRLIKDERITDMELYQESNYVCYIASQILSVDDNEIYDRYNNLPIKSISDIDIKPIEVINLLELKDKSKVKLIMNDLAEKIINKELINNKELLTKYIINKYKNVL